MDDKELNFDDFVIGDALTEPIDTLTGTEEATNEEESESKTEETPTNEDAEETEEISVEEEETEDVEETNDEVEQSEDSDDGESDGEQTFLPIIEMMHEHNGWEFDGEQFQDGTMDGLMDFISEVVEANSRPQYASEESARFDEFIRRYGPEKAQDFLSANFSEVDYETIDLEDEENMKQVHRDYLKATTKFSEEKIEKQIRKMEDLGELDEDVDEYKEYLIKDKAERAANIEKQAQAERENKIREHKEFMDSKKQEIMSLNKIAEFDVSDKDKEGLYAFAYEFGKDGRTGFQKMRDENPNLDLELLWYAYKGLTESKVSKKVESRLSKELKKNLSRYTDKNVKKGSGTPAPGKKGKGGSDVNYNEFVLK